MKKIFYILLTGILLCPSVKTMTQTRNVYWIHGLSGNAASLEPHDTYFKPLYQINSYRPSVTTANGIQGSAQALYADQKFIPDANNRNIIVAHSMGGVNSVWLHKYANGISSGKGSKYVGGLISMGSPYKGAYVANNIDNGVMDKLISEGVYKGGLGVRSEPAVIAAFMTMAPILSAINALFGNPKPATLYDLMNMTSNGILHYITDVIVTQSAATRNSLKVGSSDINAIQQYTSFTVPSIALYGVEDYPATLRFITSRLAKTVNVDESFTDIVGLVSKMYQTSATFSAAHSDMAVLSLFQINPLAYNIHRWLAGNWAVSRDYWNGGVQAATDVLTGCYRTTTVTERIDQWVIDDDCEEGIPYMGPEKQAYTPLCTDGHWELITVTRTVVINEPGDGLVPINSPQAMPGCLKTVKMDHTNHDEMKYSSASQGYLNDVFSGKTTTTRDPIFFRLTKK
jgi:hypothetical protein